MPAPTAYACLQAVGSVAAPFNALDVQRPVWQSKPGVASRQAAAYLM